MIKIILALIVILGFIAYQYGPDYIRAQTRLHECERFALSDAQTMDCASSAEAHKAYSRDFFDAWRGEFKTEFLNEIPSPDKTIFATNVNKQGFKQVQTSDIIDAYDVIFHAMLDIESPIELNQKIVFKNRFEYTPPSFGNFGGYRLSIALNETEKLTLPMTLDGFEKTELDLIKKYCVITCPAHIYGMLERFDDPRNPGLFLIGFKAMGFDFDNTPLTIN